MYSFWVCEKSDGIRILFFICTGGRNDQTVYIVSRPFVFFARTLKGQQIDRHNTYRCINGFFFPHHMDPQLPLRSTLIDGELVLDVDARGTQTLRLLCFDCLAIDDENVMSRSLDKRYGVSHHQ
jgi:mRNA guanylyltransferase